MANMAMQYALQARLGLMAWKIEDTGRGEDNLHWTVGHR